MDNKCPECGSSPPCKLPGYLICTRNQLTAHKQLLADQCEHESEARKIAMPVIGSLAAFGDQYGVPTIADVVEAFVAKNATLRAKYERAIKELESCARDYEIMNRAIGIINGHECPDDGVKKAHNWPPRFHEFTQGPESVAAILAESQETP